MAKQPNGPKATQFLSGDGKSRSLASALPNNAEDLIKEMVDAMFGAGSGYDGDPGDLGGRELEPGLRVHGGIGGERTTTRVPMRRMDRWEINAWTSQAADDPNWKATALIFLMYMEGLPIPISMKLNTAAAVRKLVEGFLRTAINIWGVGEFPGYPVPEGTDVGLTGSTVTNTPEDLAADETPDQIRSSKGSQRLPDEVPGGQCD